MTHIVVEVMKSMVRHDPYTLPLAPVYDATENSHPAALGMMTLWRTVTSAGEPDFLAIDPVRGQAFFLMQISEARDLSVLWGRIEVVDRKITQLELYINRSRGDHGFSFSASNLPANVGSWMHPPADRVVASRAELERLSRAAFNASDPISVKIGRNCQFLEAGSHIIDPGLGPGFGPVPAHPEKPLGCMFPPFRPTDLRARTVVIDQKLGIVVDAGMVRGKVYAYPFFGHMISAFIPDDMRQAQELQERWYRQMIKEGKGPLLQPAAATGVTMQVLQFYNGKLQGLQIDVHLEGPAAQSVWVGQDQNRPDLPERRR
ncbi:MAG: hypothetical protein WAU49_01220 [Steroidobacteraceae bacterium]